MNTITCLGVSNQLPGSPEDETMKEVVRLLTEQSWSVACGFWDGGKIRGFITSSSKINGQRTLWPDLDKPDPFWSFLDPINDQPIDLDHSITTSKGFIFGPKSGLSTTLELMTVLHYNCLWWYLDPRPISILSSGSSATTARHLQEILDNRLVTVPREVQDKIYVTPDPQPAVDWVTRDL